MNVFHNLNIPLTVSIKNANSASLKNLCSDIQYVRVYLAKIANEKQKE